MWTLQFDGEVEAIVVQEIEGVGKPGPWWSRGGKAADSGLPASIQTI